MSIDIDLSGGGDELPPGVQPGHLGGTDEPPEPVAASDPEAGQFAEPENVPPPDVPWDGEVRDGSLGGDDGEPEEPATPEGGTDETMPADSLSNDELAAVLQNDTETFPEAGQVLVPEALEELRQRATEGDGAADEILTRLGLHEPPAEAPTPVETSGEEEKQPEAETKPAEAKPKRKRSNTKKKASDNASGTITRLYFIFQETQAEVDGNIIPVFVRCMFNVDGEVVEGFVARNADIALRRAADAFGHDYEGTLVAVPSRHWQPKPVANKPEPRYKVTVG